MKGLKFISKNVYVTIGKSEVFKAVANVVMRNRKIQDRLTALNEEHIIAFYAGTGGVLSIKLRRDGAIYVQISCGVGKWNYAKLIQIGTFKVTDRNEAGLFNANLNMFTPEQVVNL